MTKSRTIDGDDVLVKLPPHETRKIVCPLSKNQKKILQDTNQTIQDQVKAEHLTRYGKAKSQDFKIHKATYDLYFSKAYQLRAAIMIFSILDFSKRYYLKLTNNESRNNRDYHGEGQ